MRQLLNRAALRDVLELRTGPAGRASDGNGKVVREKEKQRDSGCLTEVKKLSQCNRRQEMSYTDDR